MPTVHFFVRDTAFSNPNPTIQTLYETDGVCRLTPKVLANFLTPTGIPDPRSSRPNLPLAFGNTLTLVTEGDANTSAIVGAYDAMPTVQQNQLFNIIDQVCFNFSNLNAIEDILVASPSSYGIYIAGTAVAGATESTTVYVGGSAQIVVPKYVTFNVNITVGTTTSPWTITVWLDSAYFDAHYPVSIITAVVPPLALTDILNLSITASTSNAFAIANESTALSLTDLSAASAITDGASGFVAYRAKVFDQANDTVYVSFNILYKGAVPGILEQRAAIRTLILNSGVGTQIQWSQRIPELFVSARYYIIPQWNTFATLPNNTLFTDIAEISALLSTTETVLYDIDSSFIQNNIACAVANYNKMMLAIVPDSENTSGNLSIQALFPTYQDWSSSDASFNFMAAAAQSFSTNLSNALAIAGGQSTNATYQILSLNTIGDPIQRNCVVFSIGTTEFWILTVESYRNLNGHP